MQEFTSSGVFVRKFGTSLNQPTGVAITSTGQTSITEKGNNRVQRFALTTAAFAYESAMLFVKAIPR